jgi:hypothetical protein
MAIGLKRFVVVPLLSPTLFVGVLVFPMHSLVAQRGSHPIAASRWRHEELPLAVGRKGEASINVLAGKLRKIL